MPSRSIRFLIDTNLFIAAVKGRRTRSTELLLMLLDGPIELVADDILISEYARYARSFEADQFLEILLKKVVVIEQSIEDVLKCKPFFPPDEGADIVHAATCLHGKAILITNDSHFHRIRDEGLIEVWSISEAMRRLLDRS
ncbi:MAG TPA: type II toxin-antitoxin system VapC family toxin [Methanothrix sp.]|nr:type II toxin-antitoxin system VapC family toxin [Methanothrix sp.]HOI68711.1 type II toxin-antitoxin system VapC family toxin [Methanothrix sp.]HPY73524.1 type II toxin-antitoxin system VapC family toxin [Methanothrix sp.]HQA63117.1 type II toxin-antitoxin system VapC family toxin [Methanothrix sp.]